MSEPRRIDVRHAGGSYPVLIAPGILDHLDRIVAERLPDRRVVVVTDRNVARAVSHPLRTPVLVVAAGESSKTRRRWSDLTDQLLGLGLGRDGALVAIGGGVVGDLAGFVAATYLRGIPFLQVPTSLLAMVDASVGGKTGVNTRHGKNLVGAFHPPAGVVIDPSVTRTLSRTHHRGGLVEAIKHGLVADDDYYRWVDEHRDRLLARDPAAVGELVERSVAIKAAIVAADEREDGVRAVLNAGHTVGHALERQSGYRLPHGEAVAAGLVAEAVLAEARGLAPAGLARDLADRLGRLGWVARFPDREADPVLLEAMRHDKKSRGATLRFALPRAPGELARRPGEWTVEAPEDDVRQALGATRTLLEPARQPLST